jgi:hypothetical protein
VSQRPVAGRDGRLGGDHVDAPIVVERAMYMTNGASRIGAGHESAGVTAPALTGSSPKARPARSSTCSS